MSYVTAIRGSILNSDTDTSLPFRVGDTLAGKYRVDRVLGVGGMGVVVAATHLDLDSKVAIKVMRDELLSDPSAVQRLMLEARSAAKIKSAHVARVLDVSTLPNGVPYIVMEFLDGCDLGQLLAERGALPVEQVADFLLQACEALAEAHAAQIIHRDLKPENLFVARDADGSPTIKVVDFGISKQLGPSASERALTNPSTAVGSPQYMAPEQMQGRQVDVRADIWALGAILYQSVTGKHAFDGQTLPEVCAKVLGQEPVSLRSLKPQVPSELEVVVLRCLKKNPEERYSDVASFATALAPFGSVGPQQRSLERINRVLKGGSAVISKVATAPTVAVGTTPMAGAATYANIPARTNSNRLVLGLIVAAVVVIGAVTFALRSPSDPPTTAASPVVAPPEPPKPIAPVPVATVETAPPVAAAPSAAPVVPSAAPVPSASTSLGSTELTAGSAGASAVVAPKPKPSTKPKPTTPTKQPNVQEAWDPNSFGGRR